MVWGVGGAARGAALWGTYLRVLLDAARRHLTNGAALELLRSSQVWEGTSFAAESGFMLADANHSVPRNRLDGWQ